MTSLMEVLTLNTSLAPALLCTMRSTSAAAPRQDSTNQALIRGVLIPFLSALHFNCSTSFVQNTSLKRPLPFSS